MYINTHTIFYQPLKYTNSFQQVENRCQDMNKGYRNCHIKTSFSDLYFQNQTGRTKFYCSIVDLFHRTLNITWYVLLTNLNQSYILKMTLQYTLQVFKNTDNTELYSEDVGLIHVCVHVCACVNDTQLHRSPQLKLQPSSSSNFMTLDEE